MKKYIPLVLLLAGTAGAQQSTNKPFKVCPEIVRASDTPCRVMGPTASIVQRDIVAEDPRDRRIKDLEARIAELEALIKQLLGAKND